MRCKFRLPSVVDGAFLCEGFEGLCMLLKRILYQCRYVGMIQRFVRPAPVLLLITLLGDINDLQGHRITLCNNADTSPPLSSLLMPYQIAGLHWKIFLALSMAPWVQHVTLGKTREWFIMATKGCIPWSFSHWPFQTT